MRNLPISQLPELTGITSNAEYAVAQGGVTYRVKAGYTSSGNLYGVFVDNKDQPLAQNVATVWTADTTVESYGVTLVDNSKFTVASGGTYNFQFSAQVFTDGNNQTVYQWFRKNGVNIDESATQYNFPTNNQYSVLAWNFVLSMNAGDYLEFVWASLTGDVSSLQHQNAQTTPVVIPEVPSIIITVTQV
jgi:hypothetical protein